jgi:Cu/Ag efflux protein CusF
VKNVLCKASLALFVLLLAASAYAEKRPHEGKITRIDQGSMVLTVQGEKGDTWDLFWTETTKLKHDLTFAELRPGDSVHFDFIEKDGKKWVTELRRTGKAKD